MNPDGSGAAILIVDDTKANIAVLVEMLRGDYRLGVATSGSMALDAVGRVNPDLILLDVMMPGMSGYEVCRRLKADETLAEVPVIFISALRDARDKTEGFAAGAVDFITKPFDASEVKARLRTHISLKQAREQLRDQNQLLEQRVRERTRELRQTQIEVVNRLGLAAEYRDTDTGMHVRRISHFCALFADACGMEAEQRELFFYAASMHDIGKIGVPDAILLKPGPLTDEERAIMQRHTLLGARMLKDGSSKLLRMAHDIALLHHERWDGTGYPHGLSGADIPLVGRITSICDVFDALTTKRPYKEAWPVERAAKLIASESGKAFDPELTRLFAELLPQFDAIRLKFADADESA